MVNNKEIEIIFSEFGPNRGDHGGVTFSGGRLDPSLSTFKNYFNNAHIKVYTDNKENFKEYENNIEIIEVDISKYKFIDKTKKRYGYHCSDYFRFVGMLESKAEVCIYTDTDMFVCSEDVRQAIHMTKIFGMCVPANPRMLLEKDILLGADAPEKSSEEFKIAASLGKMHSFNTAPLFFDPSHENARNMIKSYIEIFEKSPIRSPSCLNLAAIKSKYFPCLLPFQWCVSRDNINDEVILHVGKAQVANKYFNNNRSR